MLTDPPCMDPLLGCSEAFFGAEGSGPQTTGGLGVLSASSSSSSSSFSSTATSASSGSFDLGRYLGSGASIARSTKQHFAMYLLKAKNTGSSAVHGIKITHGPFPYNLAFDSAKSASECRQNQSAIECMVDLGPGQSKDLTIAYKTSSAFSCGLARFLQTAKATMQNVTGTANPVVVSVSCNVESGDLSSSSSGGVYDSGPTLDNTLALSQLQAQPAGNKPYATGYKSYVVMPRTGAGDFFAATTTTDGLSAPRPLADGKPDSLFLFPITILSVLSMVLVVRLVRLSVFA